MTEPKKVTAAIIRDGAKVLIARRAPTEPSAGKWEFPGGKLEPGETPEECLARELQEELGVQVSVGELFATSTYTYPGGTIELVAYLTEVISGECQLRVHDAIHYVTPRQMLKYDLLPADFPIARRLLENE